MKSVLPFLPFNHNAHLKLRVAGCRGAMAPPVVLSGTPRLSQNAAGETRRSRSTGGIEPGVLFFRKFQENGSRPLFDDPSKRLASAKPFEATALLGEDSHLLRRLEHQRPGQDSPKILVQELAPPTVAELYEHVNTAPTHWPGTDPNEG
jgi:hypothetical protein